MGFEYVFLKNNGINYYKLLFFGFVTNKYILFEQMTFVYFAVISVMKLLMMFFTKLLASTHLFKRQKLSGIKGQVKVKDMALLVSKMLMNL
jgi:hypothetical protein